MDSARAMRRNGVTILFIFATVFVIYLYVRAFDRRTQVEKIIADQKHQDEQQRLEYDKQRQGSEAHQRILDKYEAECRATSKDNYNSFKEMLDSCETQQCSNNLMNNKKLQYFGKSFIDDCIAHKIDGTWLGN